MVGALLFQDLQHVAQVGAGMENPMRLRIALDQVARQCWRGGESGLGNKAIPGFGKGFLVRHVIYWAYNQ